MNSKKAFTLIELLVVVSIIALLIAILLPALGIARRTARKMSNSTQMRGIHQGMVNYAQGNKTPTGDGFFPGLTNRGKILTVAAWPTDGYAGDSMDGKLPSTRLTIELNSGFVSPDYVLGPNDGGKPDMGPAATQTATGTGVDKKFNALSAASSGTDVSNFSYAMSQISDATTDTGRTQEWSERINGQAAILCDRNVASSATDAESVWTDKGKKEWEGTVVFNDNSAQFISRIPTGAADGLKRAKLEATRYANDKTCSEDDLFAEDTTPAGANALMVHATATDVKDQSPFR